MSIFSHERLSQREKIGYGAGDLGGCLFFTFIGIWLLHYFTDVIGINAAIAGSIIALGKIWDAITDPLIGYLSDHTKTRLGRRRPWMLSGCLPVLVAMFLLFSPPALNNSSEIFWWGLLSYCFLSTAMTCINIPYSALTPELTNDYHQQSSLNGYRFFFAGIGALIAAGLTLPLVHYFSSASLGFYVVGIVYGLVIILSTLITVLTTQERPYKKPSNSNFISAYKTVFQNKAFLILLGVYCLNVIGLSIIMGIAVYYFKYIHGDESYTTWAMLALLLSSLVFIPFAVRLSHKLGKKFCYLLGLSLYCLVLVFIYLVGHLLPPIYSVYVMIIAGIGQSFCYVMPYSMIPDTIQCESDNTVEKNEGAYYGAWTFFMKSGQAIALLICGQLLNLSRYNVNHEISTNSLNMIKTLIGPVSIGFYALSILVLFFYPLNESHYNALMEKKKYIIKA